MLARSAYRLVSRSATRFGVSHRDFSMSITPLTEQHAEFLSMVAHHGEGDITLEIMDKVAVVSINNAAKRNAVSGKMMAQLARIVDDIVPAATSTKHGASNHLVGLVLRGIGNGAFCSGADLSLVKNIVTTSEHGVLMASFMTDALNRIRQSALISVCLINGPAIGGGSETTTSCDFRVMAGSAKNHIQFVHAKIGASPGWGGARRLTNIVGRRDALRVCASSLPVTPEEALRIGLIDQIVPCSSGEPLTDAQLLEAGLAYLRPFTTQPYSGSVRAIKTAVASVEECTAEESRLVELNMFAQRWGGPDNRSSLDKK